jgi:hypothetical protein
VLSYKQYPQLWDMPSCLLLELIQTPQKPFGVKGWVAALKQLMYSCTVCQEDHAHLATLICAKCEFQGSCLKIIWQATEQVRLQSQKSFGCDADQQEANSELPLTTMTKK